MNIKILSSEDAFFKAVAAEIRDEIIRNPSAVIGLSTGRTTGPIHKALAAMYAEQPFDTSRVTIFGLDEVTNVSRDYFGSCYYMLLHEVVLPLNIPSENYIMPPSQSDDFEAEGRKFQKAIEERGQVDLQILGIGANGHIGFNQPGTPFGQETWVGSMEPWLYERIRKETDSPEGADLRGLTLGIKNVMHSKRILLCANGEAKAPIIRDMVTGPVTEDLPASVLQLHPFAEVYVDPAAGSLLP